MIFTPSPHSAKVSQTFARPIRCLVLRVTGEFCGFQQKKNRPGKFAGIGELPVVCQKWILDPFWDVLLCKNVQICAQFLPDCQFCQTVLFASIKRPTRKEGSERRQDTTSDGGQKNKAGSGLTRHSRCRRPAPRRALSGHLRPHARRCCRCCQVSSTSGS